MHQDHHDCAGAQGLAAPSAHELSPTSDAACGTNAGRHGDHENKHDDPIEATAARKRLDTVTAELALQGFELRRTAEGPLLVIRWGQVRELRDVDAAETFAVAVGARE